MTIPYRTKLIVLSLVGLVASFWQAVERIHMLKNPSAPLSCDLNPVVDCGTVLNHPLAALFGFPNAFIGVVVFSMLLAIGLTALGTGNSKRPWGFLLGLTTILLGFSLWFFGVSVYIIGKICIFCIAIWLVSVPLITYTLREFLEAQNKLPKVKKILQTQGWAFVLLAYAIMFILFLSHFRGYYF